MSYRATRRDVAAGSARLLLVAGLAAAPAPASAQSGEPIKIGFSMALTGPLAPNGKQALLGAKIWARGDQRQGRSARPQGRTGEYDDQSNPANMPGIYTKLLDVDKVDIVMGPYGDQHERASDAQSSCKRARCSSAFSRST